jgi:ribonuclease BN (tRNA processing enzyme)
VRLTVLGSSAAWPAPGGAASGYLLEHDGFVAALDLGTGALANLQLHVPHESLGAIVLTHEHMDHCIDLYPLFTARRFHPVPLPPLPVYAPPGVFERVAALEDEEGVAEMRRVFDVREVEPGSEFETGPLRISTRLLPHWVPNSGLRIQADGLVLAYTGDTGPSPDIERIAKDADLLVTEASWLDEERAPGGPAPYHLTARQAAEHALRAGAKRLLLSHFWPGLDRDVSRQQAAEAYRDEPIVAREGLAVEVAG